MSKARNPKKPPSPSPDQAVAPAGLEHVVEMAELVAHEINNLLNNILLHVALMDRKGHDAIRTELGVIRQAGTRAGALINRWQQISPRHAPQLQPTDLNQAVSAAVTSWKAAEKDGARVPVRIEPAPELPAVLADPAALTRLIRLLLVNAAAAVDQGSITLRTEREAPEVVLHVEDTGPGFDPSLLDRLFEPFVLARPLQSEADLRPQQDLGLAVCRRLARRQQATIQAENRPEGGVRVSVHFRPAEEEQDRPGDDA